MDKKIYEVEVSYRAYGSTIVEAESEEEAKRLAVMCLESGFGHLSEYAINEEHDTVAERATEIKEALTDSQQESLDAFMSGIEEQD